MVVMPFDGLFQRATTEDSHSVLCIVESAAGDCFSSQDETEMECGDVERRMMVRCYPVSNLNRCGIFLTHNRKMEAFGRHARSTLGERSLVSECLGTF